MAEAAALLCLDSPRTYQRYETGENRPDVPIVERICTVSGGGVTVHDLHMQRREWLFANKPSAFDAKLPILRGEAAE